MENQGPGAAVPARRWTAAAGAWLGIGAAPGALVLGARVGERHGGDVPVVALVVGGAAMAALLVSQGMLGLVSPWGENSTLSAVTPRYLPRIADRALAALMALAMVGWFGFNVGLGGAALAALLDVPGPVGPLLLGLPVVAVSLAGQGTGWNGIAMVTTVSALVLVVLVGIKLAPPSAPVAAGVDRWPATAADVASFVGYVSVFATRAPDFSVGLRRRRDLAWCVGMLVVPAVAVAVIGAGVTASTGSADLVGTLAAPGGLAVGNLFVAASVVAPAFTTTYSGPLALRRVLPVSYRAAVLIVAGPGLVLAALRFDRVLLGWLALLAAVLPPLIVPMALEAARRRRGRAPRMVPTWTWIPASALALLLTVLGQETAPLVGLALAGALTAAWVTRAREPSR